MALRPLIKIMLRNGVDVAQFTALARSVYVSVAQDPEFALEAKNGTKRKVTHSRIAVLTGINRKEVKQLIQTGSLSPRRTTMNRAVRVVTGWVENERFHDEKGEPIPLSYYDKDEKNSFEALVQTYSADTTPRVILDELINVGSARLEDGMVYLIEKGYVPTLDDQQMIELGSRAIADLSSSVEHNIHRQSHSPNRLQLSVSYDNIPEQGAALFRSVLKKDADEFLNKQNKILSSLDRDENPDVVGTGNCRVGVGIYYFENSTDE